MSLASRLHEVLMELQHKQLQQLTDWLDVTEARIRRMGAQPLGPDLEDVKHQVEEHKVRSASGLWPLPSKLKSLSHVMTVWVNLAI